MDLKSDARRLRKKKRNSSGNKIPETAVTLTNHKPAAHSNTARVEGAQEKQFAGEKRESQLRATEKRNSEN